MSNDERTFIVDDDDSVRHSLRWLLESVKKRVETYACAEDFLKHVDTDRVGCLILDVRMPKMNGLELQQILKTRNSTIPIIILTGHGDVPMAVRAMAEGAFDFVQKPFNGPQLLDRVNSANILSKKLVKEKIILSELEMRNQLLTPRERQAMDMIASGKANKVIAVEMGIGQRTVEVHRHRVMEKMQAHSVAELMHFYLRLKKG